MVELIDSQKLRLELMNWTQFPKGTVPNKEDLQLMRVIDNVLSIIDKQPVFGVWKNVADDLPDYKVPVLIYRSWRNHYVIYYRTKNNPEIKDCWFDPVHKEYTPIELGDCWTTLFKNE